jgi:hypothetical protein
MIWGAGWITVSIPSAGGQLGFIQPFQTISNTVLGAELLALGLLIFMLAYVLLRLLNERREHSRKNAEKHDSDELVDEKDKES